MTEAANLVPGRACDGCTVCCRVPLIDTPEIQKMPGLACRHSLGGGCDIYATRPGVCRAFLCGWRTLELIPPDWRPDECGVLTMLETQGIPPGFRLRAGVGLLLFDNPLKTVRQRWFQDFVSRSLLADVPLFLSVAGPRGSRPVQVIINTAEMMAAVRSRMAGRIKDELEKALKRLCGYDFQPYQMKHEGNDVGFDDD